MKMMMIVDFTAETDPIRHRHGLARLLSYADGLVEMTRQHGVQMLTPVIWECDQPKGYCVLEVESADTLQPFIERFGRRPTITLVHVRFLDEVVQLGRQKLVEIV